MNLRLASMVLIGLLILTPAIIAKGDNVKKVRALGRQVTEAEVVGDTTRTLSQTDETSARTLPTRPTKAPTKVPKDLTSARQVVEKETEGPTKRTLGQTDKGKPELKGRELAKTRGEGKKIGLTKQETKKDDSKKESSKAQPRHTGKVPGYQGKSTGQNAYLSTVGRKRSP